MITSLKINNLSISHIDSNSKRQINICENVNLSFNEGEIVGILGPNGSGKSTFLNAILNRKDYSGEIIFNNNKDYLPVISTIPQDFRSSFFNWTSLKNNIKFCKNDFISNWFEYGKQIEGITNNLGIDLDLNLRPRNCSGGMVQQASIVRALFNNEGLIIADEPFSALDTEVSNSIRFNFRKIVKKNKIMCLIVLHNLDDLKSICDKIILIPDKPYSSNNSTNNTIEEIINFHLNESFVNNSSLKDIAKKVFQNEN